MTVYYFGCIGRTGHYMFSSPMPVALEEGRACSSFTRTNPWGTQIDGGLCPGGREIQGQALIHYKAGWTALSFWDRSVDARGNSNSNFLAHGTLTFEEILRLAKERFPEVFARLHFPIVPYQGARRAAGLTNQALDVQPIPGDRLPWEAESEKLGTCKANYVGAPAIFALEQACREVSEAFDGFGCYLVGSAIQRPTWRDVDVRYIMADEEFAQLFPSADQHWEQDARWLLLTVSISERLSKVTGLPIDFQFQPQTYANEHHKGPRHSIGLRIAKHTVGLVSGSDSRLTQTGEKQGETR